MQRPVFEKGIPISTNLKKKGPLINFMNLDGSRWIKIFNFKTMHGEIVSEDE